LSEEIYDRIVLTVSESVFFQQAADKQTEQRSLVGAIQQFYTF
jgi:hypothetical protein